MNVTKESWMEALDLMLQTPGGKAQPVYWSVKELGLCPASVIDPLSFLLLETFTACGGTSRIATPNELWSLPPLYYDATRVIADEFRRAQKWKELLDAKC